MKIKAKANLTILCLFNLLGMNLAQQSPLTSLVYKDRFRLIPAYAGVEGTLMGSAIYRNQWQDLAGHPHGIDLAIHFPVYEWGSAMGIQIGQEELGLERHTFIKPSIHKVSKINEVLLTAGIEAEFDWTSFQSESARTPEGNYQGSTIDHNDPGLTNSRGSNGLVDLGMSLYAVWNRLQVGVALEKLIQSAHNDQPFPWANRRNLKALGAYEFKWLNLDFQAQMVLNTDFVKLQTDFFSGFDYNGSIFGGIHFRGYNGNSLESLGFSLGFSLSKTIQMAYCHEIYIGAIPVNYVSASQEIGLFYNFGKAFGLGKAPRIIHSPRYSD